MMDLMSGPWGPALIFLLRIGDVSIATMRVILMVRGSRLLAPLLGFFEILLWIVAAGAAIRNLSSPWHVIGYAAGFAGGTAVGMWLESLLALGVCSVRAISRGSQRELGEDLRRRGFGVTELSGRGREGPVELLYAVVRRREVPEVLESIEVLDPDAFVTVQNDAVVHRGWLYQARRK